MNDSLVLESVFDADVTEEVMDIYNAMCNVLGASTLNSGQICTALMWATGYFLAERTSSGCNFGRDLKELEEILEEYFTVLEDTAEKATIALRDDSTSASLH